MLRLHRRIRERLGDAFRRLLIASTREIVATPRPSQDALDVVVRQVVATNVATEAGIESDAALAMGRRDQT
jgi:hypothetical protein